ncbi:MAG TPA: VOC family protein [Candidatus Kapabacteria bacterium]|nr:VOC family protein [Candidatus Kapabacteria bacterium]
MSRIIRFEIHASQPQALIDFYSALLGWRFTEVPAIGYWRIETGSPDEPGINGGLVQRPTTAPVDSTALNAFVCTAEVTSLDDTLATASELGAVVALPKMEIAGMGLLAYIIDPDGNILGLLQPDGTH